MKKLMLCAAALAIVCTYAWAEEMVIDIHLVDASGVGKSIGSITASQSPYGVVLTPNLGELPPGVHGFHLHQNPSCDPGEKDGKKAAAIAAGPHLDPAVAKSHKGPYAEGHLGDLPALFVGTDGKATTPVLAPRLKLVDLKGHSLMIHAGGDNYSDQPELGGGGARMACGIVK